MFPVTLPKWQKGPSAPPPSPCSRRTRCQFINYPRCLCFIFGAKRYIFYYLRFPHLHRQGVFLQRGINRRKRYDKITPSNDMSLACQIKRVGTQSLLSPLLTTCAERNERGRRTPNGTHVQSTASPQKTWNNIGYMEGKVQKWQREGAMCHIDVACRLYTNPTTANTW